ncbi:hypothetical protein HMPREF3208_00122 [Gardnerella vaginalis]|uniref:Nucleotide exchange factor GrpE n=1 Tax=Gardnerella vaginalis TaxID=2702 RepID=A0A133P304_GARVA|nr:nucleotide exchange factor GrpE [Gardnerella vaginalis]KXA22892.1 hypothetical protein HMPREF3208_00122 [Gardnerella vaginalis]
MDDANLLKESYQTEGCVDTEELQPSHVDHKPVLSKTFTVDENTADAVPQRYATNESNQEAIMAETPVEDSSVTPKKSQCEDSYKEALNNLQSSIIDNLQEHHETLHNDLNEVSSVLAMLNKQFTQRLQYDKVKETVIDRQHKELEEFREGLNHNLQRPLLYDIAETLDDIRKTKLFYAKKENSELAIKALEGVEDSLNYILEKNNVECASSSEGDPFTGTCQRMIKSIPTSDISKQRTIAESVAPGYIFDKETLFKEKVIVYKYVPDYTETGQQVQPAEIISTPTPDNEETAEFNTFENTNK